MSRRRVAALALIAAVTMGSDPSAQTRRIYWGDEVPAGWTGKWSADLLTVPERTGWTRTMSTLQLHEWIAALKLKTEFLHVETMFVSPLRKAAPVMVFANPRVTSPRQAKASGKPVVFLLGAVLAGAEAGTLTNFLDGEYRSAGTIDLLAYPTNEPMYKPGTSLLGTRPGTASGPPEVVRGVDDLTKPVGTRTATVPRAYVLPPALGAVAAKLRAHNIAVTTLAAPATLRGEQFTVDRMYAVRRSGYDMTTLDGSFSPLISREFPAGSFVVDMAQPMANAAFYFLEPQARDGFVGWGVMDEALRALGAAGRSVVYPVFKVRRLP